MFAVQISFAIPLFVQPCFRGSPIFTAAVFSWQPKVSFHQIWRTLQISALAYLSPSGSRKLQQSAQKRHMRLKVTIYESWALFFLKKAPPFEVLLNAGNPHRNLDSCVEFPAALISWHHQSSYFRQNQVHGNVKL